jgi:very-short-patch-repair endonuclease
VFGSEAFKVNYVTRVLSIREVPRFHLFPDQPADARSNRLYYQLFVEPLRVLPRPIYSQRRRRITFIPTTWQRFAAAHEINDLYHGSAIEELLWSELRRLQIMTERQEEIQTKTGFYFLDFAIHCAGGGIDVETDGDAWHANPERAGKDNLRDNELEVAGWHLLRFRGQVIKDHMAEYCIPRIVKEINNCGGIDEGKARPRKIDLAAPPGLHQPSLFDTL